MQSDYTRLLFILIIFYFNSFIKKYIEMFIFFSASVAKHQVLSLLLLKSFSHIERCELVRKYNLFLLLNLSSQDQNMMNKNYLIVSFSSESVYKGSCLPHFPRMMMCI